jgi:hypothetical protein
LSSSSGAPTGLSEVRWTRTTVGGPNYLGGSVTVAPRALAGPNSPRAQLTENPFSFFHFLFLFFIYMYIYVDILCTKNSPNIL